MSWKSPSWKPRLANDAEPDDREIDNEYHELIPPDLRPAEAAPVEEDDTDMTEEEDTGYLPEGSEEEVERDLAGASGPSGHEFGWGPGEISWIDPDTGERTPIVEPSPGELAETEMNRAEVTPAEPEPVGDSRFRRLLRKARFS